MTAPAWIHTGRHARDARGLPSQRARLHYEAWPIEGVLTLDLRLPRFQRQVVWSVEQQQAFAQAVFDGVVLPTPIVIWRPRNTLDHFVIDGQQRLTALDVPLTRADSPQPRQPLALDVLAGRIVIDDKPTAPRYRLRDIADFIAHRRLWLDLWKGHDDEVADAVSHAYAALNATRLHFLTIEGSAADAYDTMRALNTPGVPYDLRALEAALAAEVNPEITHCPPDPRLKRLPDAGRWDARFDAPAHHDPSAPCDRQGRPLTGSRKRAIDPENTR